MVLFNLKLKTVINTWSYYTVHNALYKYLNALIRPYNAQL